MKLAALAVVVVVAVLAVLAQPLSAAPPPPPGWWRIDIPSTGSDFWLYIPNGVDLSRPTPLVLFFHGAGANPAAYRGFLGDPADKTGSVVAMPRSSGLGWGTQTDASTVSETLRMVREILPVDDRRIAVAGHSAGGAYAYLLAYSTGSRYSAVFTLASPFYQVSSLADSSYTPPIRMYYGTTDPNYTGGAYDKLKAQWNRLGVPWEEDVQVGFDHGSWPDASMLNGFLFLAGKTRPETGACVPTATNLCLNRGRFRVEVNWTANGTSGSGKVVPGAAADSGLFWFFGPDNWEVMVKVLDGCALNARYWVFAAATTDVHYVLTVTDTATGKVKQYENPAGRAAAATTDTSAFATCP